MQSYLHLKEHYDVEIWYECGDAGASTKGMETMGWTLLGYIDYGFLPSRKAIDRNKRSIRIHSNWHHRRPTMSSPLTLPLPICPIKPDVDGASTNAVFSSPLCRQNPAMHGVRTISTFPVTLCPIEHGGRWETYIYVYMSTERWRCRAEFQKLGV